MSSGRFDVILTANNDSASVQRLLVSGPDAAIVVSVDDLAKNQSLLEAIDKAVLVTARLQEPQEDFLVVR